MISVHEAKQLVVENTLALPPVMLPLHKAAGLMLAEDVFAKTNVPAFEQSAMDGYAFRFNDWANDQLLAIEGEVPAGRTDKLQLPANKATRIFTGAPIPLGADTVVMQEKTIITSNLLKIITNDLEKGTNVRKVGSEISESNLALSRGTILSPGAIGFLATIGEDKVPVYRIPKVSIVVTGKEIKQPGTALMHGQVYDCNSFTLHAALLQLNIVDVKIEHADDDPSIIEKAIARHLTLSDIVLVTGGVSVGDYDFVIDALEQCEVKQVFHKIKQRPGKPLYFGIKKNKLVFGLPGNPSSVLTCFYEYVIPALEKMMQRTESIIKKVHLPLSVDYGKTTGLTHFLKGFCNNGEATPLSAQESYKLQSFAHANCLICLPQEKEEFKKNEVVEVHILP